MTTQTIKFSNGITLPVIAVYSKNELIRNAYRECFEIRFSTEDVTFDSLSSLAVPENLSELILTEKNDETDEVTSQFSHRNFTVVTGMGMKTASEDGAKFFFLSVAQKSESELLMERLTQDNEDIKSALVELAEIISEV